MGRGKLALSQRVSPKLFTNSKGKNGNYTKQKLKKKTYSGDSLIKTNITNEVQMGLRSFGCDYLRRI